MPLRKEGVVMGRNRKSKRARETFRKAEWPPGLYQRANGRFFWRRRLHGQRGSEFFGRKRESYAVKRAIELNEEIDDKDRPMNEALAKGSKTFRSAAEEYIVSRQLRQSTCKRYDGILRNMLRVGEKITGKPGLLVRDVNDKFMSQFIARRKIEPVSPNGHPNTRKTLKGASDKTVSEERNFAMAVLRFAVTRQWLGSMPVIQSRIKGASGRKSGASAARPLDEEEMKRIFRAAREYDKTLRGRFPYRTYFHDIIRTYVFAGLRHEELRMLEWADVDLKAALIKVRVKKVRCRRHITVSTEARKTIEPLLRGKKRNALAVPDNPDVLTKIGDLLNFKVHDALRSLRGKDFDFEAGIVNFEETFEWGPKASEGEVVMHPRLRETLKALKGKNPSNFVFPDNDGGYWRLRFERHLQRIAKLADIPDFTRVHDLRHTTGAMLRRKGVALETIKEILRHQNIEDTLIYAKYEHAEGREAIRKIPW